MLGMLVLTPILLLAMLAIRLSSPGPVFYHQRRVGQHGLLFTVHKLRSMRVDAEAETGAVWASANDARVTPVGKFLRRTRIDEIPQLWNVLKGEMSLVGPRPERPEFVADLTEKIPFYGIRHGNPWTQRVWAYDANDLAAVKAGSKQPWSVVPYAWWDFEFPQFQYSHMIKSAAYDPSTQRIYLASQYGDVPNADYNAPIIHVYELK